MIIRWIVSVGGSWEEEIGDSPLARSLCLQESPGFELHIYPSQGLFQDLISIARYPRAIS